MKTKENLGGKDCENCQCRTCQYHQTCQYCEKYGECEDSRYCEEYRYCWAFAPVPTARV